MTLPDLWVPVFLLGLGFFVGGLIYLFNDVL